MTIDTIPHSWSPLLLIYFICITSSFLLSHQTNRVTHPLDKPKKEDRFNQAIRSSKVVIDCTSHNRWPYHRFRAYQEGSSTPKIQTEDPRRTARSRTEGAQRGRQHRPRPRLQRSRQLRTNKNTQQNQKGSLQQISEVWKNRRTTDRTYSRQIQRKSQHRQNKIRLHQNLEGRLLHQSCKKRVRTKQTTCIEETEAACTATKRHTCTQSKKQVRGKISRA